MHAFFRRALIVFWLLGWAPARVGAQPTISAETYHAQLQTAQDALRQAEAKRPFRLDIALRPLIAPRRVRRADGETQTSSGDEWQRRLDDAINANPKLNLSKTRKPNAPVFGTKAMLRDARAALNLRQQALNEWTRPAPKYFEAPDAQKIFAGVESSGQIRTAPTALQQFWAGVGKSISEAWDDFIKWVEGLFPRPTGTVRPLRFNPQWLTIGFYLAVGALLLVVGFTAWRALGGRWRREGARRDVKLAGEDAELLRLPPDELAERAARFAAEGNFREALRHLYLSLLLQMDARRIWRYDSRRTNWEHIAALRAQWTIVQSSNPALQSTLNALTELTRRFDRVRYGNASCDEAAWKRFENDVNGVREAIPRLPTSAAQATTRVEVAR